MPVSTPIRWLTTGFDQNSPGVTGTSERGDGFGTAVSTYAIPSGDLHVLVSTPGEDIGSIRDAGMVQVVGASNHPAWSQASEGVPGTPETGDRMGATLSAQLARVGPLIGVPGEDDGRGAVLSGLPQINGPVTFWAAAVRTDGAHFAGAVAP